MANSDDDQTRPENPLPPPPTPAPVRSAQPTLVMGGNVNADTGSVLPPPPVVPPHLSDQNRPSSPPTGPLPPPPATPPPAKVQPTGGGAHPSGPLPPPATPLPTPAQAQPPVTARTGSARPLPSAAPVPLAGRSLPRPSAPPPSLTKTLPPRPAFQWPQVKWPDVEFAKLWTTAKERAAYRYHISRNWLDVDKRRWALPGGAAFVLLSGVGLCTFSGSGTEASQASQGRIGVTAPDSQAAADDDTDRRAATTKEQKTTDETTATTKQDPSNDTATDVDALPTLETLPRASLADTIEGQDERFAVRKRKSLDSCDAALDKPFQPEAEPNRGKAGAAWKASRSWMMRGRKEDALKAMCESASWDLKSRGTYGLSEFYFREGDFEQALTWAKRVPNGTRRYVDAQAMIGDVYSQVGDVKSALEAYIDGWNMDAKDQAKHKKVAAQFANSAATALRKKDWWTAERFYRRSLTLNENDADAAAGLARVFIHFDFPKSAVSWAEHAVRLDGDSATAAIALCEAQIASGDEQGAKKTLKRLRKMASDGDPQIESLAVRIDAMK